MINFTNTDIKKILPVLKICSKLIYRIKEEKLTLVSQIRERQKKEESTDNFLASVSHELKTPLNGIVGMITMLPDAGQLNDKQKLYVKNLTECTFQLANLMNNILDFSKMSSGRFVLTKNPFLVREIFQELSLLFDEKTKSKNIHLQFIYYDTTSYILGDKQRIVQILTNLIGNSVKFTEKGSITTTLDISKINDRLKLSFIVEDTGVGIPPNEQEKIFEMFHHSTNLSNHLNKYGTGLGLAISKQLVLLMNGEISVQSKGVNGLGSKFTFYVMLDEYLDPKKINKNDKILLKESKILVVDDRQEIRLQLSDILLKWKTEPIILASAEEALKYLSRRNNFDIAIIDICMPFMSGIELAQTLRRLYPRLDLIALSSVNIDNGVDYFDIFLYKPIDESVLYESVLSCLKKNKIKDKRKFSDSKQRHTPHRKKNLKILIAEDDVHNSFTIREMLINLGFQTENITLVENGKECVEEAKKNKYHIILMDIIMPVMDGIEATKYIRQFSKPPMIIAVSASAQQSDKTRCLRVGIDGYLSKPITKENLLSALSPLIK